MENFKVTSSIDLKTYFNISLRIFFGRRALISILIVIAAVNVFLFIDSGFDWLIELFIFVYVILFYGIIMPIIIYWTCKRNMNKMAGLREILIYTISEDKIELKAETMSSSSNWQYVTRLVEREKYFMIRTGVKAFHYLPKDGFESKEDMARLKNIVKEKGIKFSYN